MVFGHSTNGKPVQNAPAPAKPRYGVAQFRDLSGPTNPTGILSPAFLMLKQALDRGDTPENVKQALYGWLSSRQSIGSSTERANAMRKVDKLLRLKPELALDRLIALIGGGIRGAGLPPLVITTLQRTLAHIAGDYVNRMEPRLRREQARLSGMRRRYGAESAEAVVASLLG